MGLESQYHLEDRGKSHTGRISVWVGSSNAPVENHPRGCAFLEGNPRGARISGKRHLGELALRKIRPQRSESCPEYTSPKVSTRSVPWANNPQIPLDLAPERVRNQVFGVEAHLPCLAG